MRYALSVCAPRDRILDAWVFMRWQVLPTASLQGRRGCWDS
ncbi:hypothetical protein [Nostoc sp.]